MSDDDIEMVDVIESPSDSGDVSNSNDSPQSASPNEGDNSELDAATRVDSLCALDEKFVSIMAKGAAIVGAISEGKLAGDAEAKRERFKQTITEYNEIVQEVNAKLRNEVKLLHEASHSKLLPLYLPVQASSLGQEKEEILLESLKKTTNE